MQALVRVHLFIKFDWGLTCIQGDPQSALGQYGDVLLLLQLCIARYEVRTSPCPCFLPIHAYVPISYVVGYSSTVDEF